MSPSERSLTGRFGSWLRELRRRRVFRVVLAYLVISWIIIQIASDVFPALRLPDWSVTLVVALVILGLPVAIILSWLFDLTPTGVSRTRDTLHTQSQAQPGAAAASPALLDPRPESAERSIAVLPFVNLSADPENEYFSDGMAEELIDRLVKIDELQVAARTSSFAFKSRNIDIGEIGRSLRVRHIVEGSVRRAGSRLRVTAQLVDVSSGFQVWSNTYEHELRDVFEIQDEIGHAIATALEVTLRRRGPAPSQTPQPSFISYDLYLKGRYLWNKRTETSLRQAVSYFEQAIAHDPSNARAYAGIADSYLVLSSTSHGSMAPSQALALAHQNAKQAVTLDPTLADGYLALGSASLNQWDWNDAAMAYRRALELEPRHAGARHRQAWWLALRGELHEALRSMQEASRLDPLSLPVQTAIARIYEFMRRSDDSIAQARRVLELDPDYVPARFALGIALVGAARPGEAVEVLRNAYALSKIPGIHCTLAYAYARNNQRAEAIDILNQLKSAAKNEYVSPTHLGDISVALGDLEHALDCYEQAYREHSPGLIYLKVEPMLDPLRGNPRFQKLLHDVGLAN